MSIEFLDAHLNITLSCLNCGHEWDIDDSDSPTLDAAKDRLESETCPKCGSQFN